MGIALPPRIYDTKSAAERNPKSANSRNGVFQQYRPFPARQPSSIDAN